MNILTEIYRSAGVNIQGKTIHTGTGFKPVWIDIDRVIQRNKALLPSDKAPKWLRREIFALEYILQNLYS